MKVTNKIASRGKYSPDDMAGAAAKAAMDVLARQFNVDEYDSDVDQLGVIIGNNISRWLVPEDKIGEVSKDSGSPWNANLFHKDEIKEGEKKAEEVAEEIGEAIERGEVEDKDDAVTLVEDILGPFNKVRVSSKTVNWATEELINVAKSLTANGNLVLEENSRGDIILYRDNARGDVLLQSDSDKQAAEEALKRNELEELAEGFEVKIPDNEPRADILSEMWESHN